MTTCNRHKWIEFWDDERAIGNSLIVTLKWGRKFSSDPLAAVHVEGFDTVREAMEAVRASIRCDCDQCNAQEQAANEAKLEREAE